MALASAFFHEDSDDIEAAAGGYTDADDDTPDELPGSMSRHTDAEEP